MNKSKIALWPKLIFAVIVTIVALFICSTVGIAADSQPQIELKYYDEVIVSAYYPAEDAAHPNNYKGIPLTDLVDEIVAAPTGSDLLGKYILIEYVQDGDFVYLFRKVEDTGCKPGRLDLLVADDNAMNVWGLRTARIFVLEDVMINYEETQHTGAGSPQHGGI